MDVTMMALSSREKNVAGHHLLQLLMMSPMVYVEKPQILADVYSTQRVKSLVATPLHHQYQIRMQCLQNLKAAQDQSSHVRKKSLLLQQVGWFQMEVCGSTPMFQTFQMTASPPSLPATLRSSKSLIDAALQKSDLSSGFHLPVSLKTALMQTQVQLGLDQWVVFLAAWGLIRSEVEEILQ
jgi:hypothetical protein